jgi:hypothetical protein
MEDLYKQNNFPALNRFSQLLKENGIKKTQKEIKDFIEKQNVNQLHKPVQKVKNNLKFITASAPNEIWQIDLLDYQKYSRQNKGFKYIFICVDIFTRFARTEVIKNKTAMNAVDAFKKMAKDEKPQAIYSDDGSEWKAEFNNLLKDKNIIHQVNDFGDHNALGIIYRFSRTIKNMIARFMTANDTKRWVDDLPRLINIYNKTPHSAIENIKPNEATERDNKVKIGTINFQKRAHNNEINKKTNDIKVGDSVRIQRIKGTFEKGYEITYTKDIFSVLKTTPLKAELSDGKSYKKEKLMKVENPTPVIQQPLLRYVRKPTVNFFKT